MIACHFSKGIKCQSRTPLILKSRMEPIRRKHIINNFNMQIIVISCTLLTFLLIGQIDIDLMTHSLRIRFSFQNCRVDNKRLDLCHSVRSSALVLSTCFCKVLMAEKSIDTANACVSLYTVRRNLHTFYRTGH